MPLPSARQIHATLPRSASPRFAVWARRARVLFSRPRKFYCNFRATARCATKLSRGITQFNFDDGHRTATAVFAEFFAIAVLIFAQSSYALASDQPYLIDLANVVPDNEGQIVNIAGGRAIAKKGIAQHLQSDDLVLVRVRGDDASGWAWVRDGAPGVDFNTDSQPIEFAWYPFKQGQDLAPFLNRLKQNWGDKLFWRPPAVDARMSFIDWGHMHTLVMKSPLADIVIYNVADSDKSHPATVGNGEGPVSNLGK